MLLFSQRLRRGPGCGACGRSSRTCRPQQRRHRRPPKRPSSDTGKTQWVFTSIPYVWASGSKSVFTTRQGETLTTKDFFFDLLGDLKFALMGASEARHGRLVLLGDLMFVKLGSSAHGHLGPIPLSADVDLKTLLVTGLVGYRAVDRGPMFFDLFAGGRITGLKANLEITGPLNTHEADYKDSILRRSLERVSELLLGGGGEQPSTAMWAASASAPTCRGRRWEQSNTTSASTGSSEEDGVITMAAPATRVSN